MKYNGFLVETDDWPARVMTASVDPENAFHPRDELRVDLRNAPHFFPATA
jgi:hypothetical protein